MYIAQHQHQYIGPSMFLYWLAWIKYHFKHSLSGFGSKLSVVMIVNLIVFGTVCEENSSL